MLHNDNYFPYSVLCLQNTKLDEEKWLSPLSLVFTAKEQIFKKQDYFPDHHQNKRNQVLSACCRNSVRLWSSEEQGWWCGSHRAWPPLEGWHILTAMGNLHFHATDRVHMVKGTWPKPYKSKGVMFLLESMSCAGQSEWNREHGGL